LQHFAFCRRQWALICLEQQWAENVRTVEGELLHERAHDEGFSEKRGDMLTVRGLRIQSPGLGVSGSCDVVEFTADPGGVPLRGREGLWKPFPVEYKRGKPKDDDIDRLQLCGQAMCLEEMLGCPVERGALYYGEIRRREQVELTKELREKVTAMLREMHEYQKRGYTPKVKPEPALPRLLAAGGLPARALQKSVGRRVPSKGAGNGGAMRRLLNTLFVLTEDSYLALEGENVLVLQDETTLGRFPSAHAEGILYFGYKGASPALMGACAEARHRSVLSDAERPLSGPRLRRDARQRAAAEKAVRRRGKRSRRAAAFPGNMIAGKLLNARWVLERATRDHPLQVDAEKLKASARRSPISPDLPPKPCSRTFCAASRARARTAISAFWTS
jgi:CRISPR-associated exonuclease Cas4